MALELMRMKDFLHCQTEFRFRAMLFQHDWWLVRVTLVFPFVLGFFPKKFGKWGVTFEWYFVIL